MVLQCSEFKSTVRHISGTWYEAVITTFLSQPNIETQEEQMFAFSEKGNIPTDEECKNQILTGCEDSQSKRCRTSVLTRTWAKRLHLLKALGLSAELLVIILSKVCKQRYQAHKRRSHEERWLKDRQDSSVSTKLEVRLELTHNHLSHRRFSTYSEGFMKQTLKGSCSVVNMQAFKKTQRTPLYLLYATEEV